MESQQPILINISEGKYDGIVIGLYVRDNLSIEYAIINNRNNIEIDYDEFTNSIVNPMINRMIRSILDEELDGDYDEGILYDDE
jgi:hypothetical protein